MWLKKASAKKIFMFHDDSFSAEIKKALSVY